MTVIENQACCIIAHRLNPEDTDILFSQNQLLFTRRMAFDFRAGAVRAQKLGRQNKYLAGVEGQLQPASAMLQPQLLGPR